MPYSEMLVRPMREELSRHGFRELKSAADVDAFFGEKSGTALLVVNSVCGCAAGMARPGAADAVAGEIRPDRLATVFAGQDLEATSRARGYFADLPPSSPSMIWFKVDQLRGHPRFREIGDWRYKGELRIRLFEVLPARP